MSRLYSRVAPAIWRSALFDRLDGDAVTKLAAMWLVTSADANPVGTYRVHLSAMAIEVGVSRKEARAALDRLASLDFLKVTDREDGTWIYVPNMARYQFDQARGAGDNRAVQALALVRKVVASPYLDEVHQDHQAYLALPPITQLRCASEGSGGTPSEGSGGTPSEVAGAYVARAPAPACAFQDNTRQDKTRHNNTPAATAQPDLARDPVPPDRRPPPPPPREHPLAGMGETRPLQVQPWPVWSTQVDRHLRCQHVLWANNCVGDPQTTERIRQLLAVAEHVESYYLAAAESVGFIGDTTDTIIRAVVMGVELGLAKHPDDPDPDWSPERLQRRLCSIVDWAAADKAWQQSTTPNPMVAQGGKYLWGGDWGLKTRTGLPVGTESRLAESATKARAWAERDGA